MRTFARTYRPQLVAAVNWLAWTAWLTIHGGNVRLYGLLFGAWAVLAIGARVRSVRKERAITVAAQKPHCARECPKPGRHWTDGCEGRLTMPQHHPDEFAAYRAGNCIV